jgi:SP family myo-inositol transporter-like MFS transporter 13
MGALAENGGSKADVLHLEKASSSASLPDSVQLEGLDSIEQTEAGRYAWLVAITAGVGGLLFG